MEILINLFFVLIYLLSIVLACNLFTNSIENLGKKFNLDKSATGSILAAVGTALPETILPLIAIFSIKGNAADGVEIGTGAILGSSFLLSAFALFISALAFIFFQKQKLKSPLNINFENFSRDYKFFIFAYFLAITSTFINEKNIKIIIGAFLICYWIFYAIKTISKSNENEIEENCPNLYFAFSNKNLEKNLFIILLQTIFSLFLLFIFSKLFVDEIQTFSMLTKISPLVVSLVLSPLATELPEITNSIIWIKNKKDSLAISNITGAMVYQASICTSIGIIFTDWKFSNHAVINIFSTICATLTVFLLTRFIKKVPAILLLSCLIWYLGFFIFISLR